MPVLLALLLFLPIKSFPCSWSALLPKVDEYENRGTKEINSSVPIAAEYCLAEKDFNVINGNSEFSVQKGELCLVNILDTITKIYPYEYEYLRKCWWADIHQSFDLSFEDKKRRTTITTGTAYTLRHNGYNYKLSNEKIRTVDEYHSLLGDKFYFGLQYRKFWSGENITAMPKIMPIEWKLSGVGKCSLENEKYYSYFFFGKYNIRIKGKCSENDLKKIIEAEEKEGRESAKEYGLDCYIPNPDPEKCPHKRAENYITAEYCLISDIKDDRWKLLSYERAVPLTIKILTKSSDYHPKLNVDLDTDIKFGNFAMPGGKSFECYKNTSLSEKYPCRGDIDEEYNIYDTFDTLLINYKARNMDSAKVSALFGKVFPIKWDLKFEIDYQPHNLSGSHNIKISGYCNKEQLKKIAEDKKKENREAGKSELR
jgi:hypothetical protein